LLRARTPFHLDLEPLSWQFPFAAAIRKPPTLRVAEFIIPWLTKIVNKQFSARRATFGARSYTAVRDDPCPNCG
jgi:hypothetical protein